MVRTRPDLAFSVGQMGRGVSKYPQWVLQVGESVLEFLHNTADQGLVYSPCQPSRGSDGQMPIQRHERLIETYSDISFAPQGGRSCQAVIGMYAGAPLMWESTKQPFTAFSTTESELLGLCESMQVGQSLEAVLTAVYGGGRFEKLLASDSTGALSVISRPDGPWRTRHLRLRATCLKEKLNSPMCDWFSYHQRGSELCADHLTKPIQAKGSWEWFWKVMSMETQPTEAHEPSNPVTTKATEVLKSAKVARFGALVAVLGELCQRSVRTETMMNVWRAVLVSLLLCASRIFPGVFGNIESAAEGTGVQASDVESDAGSSHVHAQSSVVAKVGAVQLSTIAAPHNFFNKPVADTPLVQKSLEIVGIEELVERGASQWEEEDGTRATGLEEITRWAQKLGGSPNYSLRDDEPSERAFDSSSSDRVVSVGRLVDCLDGLECKNSSHAGRKVEKKGQEEWEKATPSNCPPANGLRSLFHLSPTGSRSCNRPALKAMSSSGLRNDPMTICELFTQPPNNAKEKWRTVTRGSEVWLVRCHGKRRYQPYHPLRSGLPCSRGAADLEPMRIQVRFGENGERRLLMDTWDAPVVTDRSMHWVGYTLFKLRRPVDSSQSHGFPTASSVSVPSPGPRGGYVGTLMTEDDDLDRRVLVGRHVHMDGPVFPDDEAGPRFDPSGMAFGENYRQSFTTRTSMATRSSMTTEASQSSVQSPARFDQPVIVPKSSGLRFGRVDSAKARAKAAVGSMEVRPVRYDDGWDVVSEDEVNRNDL